VRRVVFLFLDGVGLGEDDAQINPLARDDYPTLVRLLEGRRAVAATGRLSTAMAWTRVWELRVAHRVRRGRLQS
jgi:hypothetical protein